MKIKKGVIIIYRPYKIKQIKFNELSSRRITEWLLYLANRTQVTNELGIGRNTLQQYGWGEITDNLEFVQLMDLQQGSTEQKQQAREIFKRWPAAKQKKYDKYQKQVRNHE